MRQKTIELGKHPYPSITLARDDDVAYERHMRMLNQEMEKLKPNMDNVKELMLRTFTRRRKWILDESHLVVNICEKYPFLKKKAIVSEFISCSYVSVL